MTPYAPAKWPSRSEKSVTSALSSSVASTPPVECAHCPRQGSPDGPICEVELFLPWDQALDGIENFERVELLYWLHQSRRDLVLQAPGNTDGLRGTFSLRSPVRPNPIGTSLVTLVARRGPRLMVRGLDCLNGPPLIDVKPVRCAYTPVAADKLGSVG